MTATPYPSNAPAPASESGCGPDCVFLACACRCYEGEAVPDGSEFRWMDHVAPVF
jgi:hypothetical protein